MTAAKVYEAIAAVQRELSHEGIEKDRKNAQQGYSFRGIDDIYNSLAPILAKHKLCILPRIISRSLIERTTSGGKPLFYVVVEAEFDFVSAEDSSKHTVKTFGEAMDMADKATNKAMSAAYKYAAMQAFCIPTEGDNDADAVTHDVGQARQPAPAKPQPTKPTGPATISREQAAQLSALLKEHAIPWAWLLGHLGLEKAGQITVERFNEIAAKILDLEDKFSAENTPQEIPVEPAA